MSPESEKRDDWELADGPVVGRDVPITNEPREEDADGAPATPDPEHADGDNDHEGGGVHSPGSDTGEESE